MQSWSKKLGNPERMALAAIRGYHLLATPLKITFGLQGCCRFSPSCSHYAQQAISLHGIGRGSKLTVKRLLRCHPWGSHGYDPVPPSPIPPALHSSFTIHPS